MKKNNFAKKWQLEILVKEPKVVIERQPIKIQIQIHSVRWRFSDGNPAGFPKYRIGQEYKTRPLLLVCLLCFTDL